MCASGAQSPVLNHIDTESMFLVDRSCLARSAHVVAKPNTLVGCQLSMVSTTDGPVCWDSDSSSVSWDSAELITISVATCGAGSALSIRSVPDAIGIRSLCLTAAKRLWCECTTAFGTPVVPDECVIATGSS